MIHKSSESKLIVFPPATYHSTQHALVQRFAALSPDRRCTCSLLVRYLVLPIFLDAPLRSASEYASDRNLPFSPAQK